LSKISIITACYQAEKTLSETIKSLEAQIHSDIEWIVVDGGSSDRTLEIAQQASLNRRIISEPDQGIYDAINKGLALATGDIVGLLHADDQLAYPEALSDIDKAFQNPNVQATYADLNYCRIDGSILRRWVSGIYNKRGWNSFSNGWMPPHPTLYLRKKTAEQIGSYRLDLGSAADYEYMLRAFHCQQIPLQYINKILVNMTTGGASNINFKARLKANRFDRKAWALNQLKTPLFLGFLKPLRKLSQYI